MQRFPFNSDTPSPLLPNIPFDIREVSFGEGRVKLIYGAVIVLIREVPSGVNELKVFAAK